MPPLDPDKLLVLLSHPVTLFFISLIGASTVSLLLGAQLRAVGLDRQPPTDGRLKWSTALAALGFWTTLVGSLHFVALRAGAPTLAAMCTQGFVALLQLFPAGLLLAGASHHRKHMLRDAADRRDVDPAEVRQSAERLTFAAAALAALTIVGRVAAPLLILGAIGAALWWLAKNPSFFQKAEGLFREVLAGVELRRRGVRPGRELTHEGRSLLITSPIGLVNVLVKDGDGEREMKNTALLALSGPTPPLDA